MTICKKQNLLKKICISILVVLLISITFSKPVQVQAAAGSYYLSMGQYLTGGKSITSSNGKYFAIMQTDGNFVIYKSSPQTALWHTQTYGGSYTSYKAIMQTDGNFVVYGIKNSVMTALWNASTQVYGSGTYRLELGDDSVLRVKKNGTTVWKSPNAAISTDPYGSLGWSWVFRGTNAYKNINQKYSSSHLGIDSNAPAGTQIYSVTSGTVIKEGLNTTMGYYVATTANATCNGNTLTTRYMHMNARSALRENDSVTSSTTIGYVGTTGNSSGNHLHLDVNILNTPWGDNLTTANTIDPLKFFPNVSFTYNS